MTELYANAQVNLWATGLEWGPRAASCSE